ncbi:hypothetical protein AB0H58_31475 [Nocardia neocaledoniensis]|uniref:hypothetical protein n=1 Tax=Nocardia neocaledoniensis TaxID=236511 RepID=UPI00245452E1|nr:hypothetical protein [Nocardia neocaledoniensis]
MSPHSARPALSRAGRAVVEGRTGIGVYVWVALGIVGVFAAQAAAVGVAVWWWR